MTSMEENLDGRQAQLKATSMEDKFNGKMEDYRNLEDPLNGRQP